MAVLDQRCCGVEGHQATVVACIRAPGKRGRRTSARQTCGTPTAELVPLADGLTAHGVAPVALERTGGLGKPVCNMLEGNFAVIWVNARHSKPVPGRQTDGRDCAWLAPLLEHGRRRASCIPPQPIRELRDLTRDRTTWIPEPTREGNRVQTRWESAHLKRGLVATAMLGASGRAILRALVTGERDGAVLAELAQGTRRQQRARVAQARTGRLTDQQASRLGAWLAPLESREAALARLWQRIAAVMRPDARQVEHPQAVPASPARRPRRASPRAGWACVGSRLRPMWRRGPAAARATMRGRGSARRATPVRETGGESRG